MKAQQQASLWAMVSAMNVEIDGDGLQHLALLRSTGDLAKPDVPIALRCFALYVDAVPNRDYANIVKRRAAKCDELEDFEAWLETQHRKRRKPPKQTAEARAQRGEPT